MNVLRAEEVKNFSCKNQSLIGVNIIKEKNTAIFLKIVNHQLISLNESEIRMLAIAFWHEGFVPDLMSLKHLTETELKVAGYLCKYFSQFNVLCDEEMDALLAVSTEIRNLVGEITNSETKNIDDVAVKWGLENDLTPYLEYFLDCQTRHYIHDSDYVRPSPNFQY